MQEEKFSYLFQFVVVGESGKNLLSPGVGKSCIVLNFAEQKPRKDHMITIACEFASRIMRVKDYNIKLQIWDTVFFFYLGWAREL